MGSKNEQTKAHITARADMAYRPVTLWHRGNDADASAMPWLVSANTIAPSMMSGHRAVRFMARAL